MDITQLAIVAVALLGIAMVAVVAVVPTLMEIPATVHHHGHTPRHPRSTATR